VIRKRPLDFASLRAAAWAFRAALVTRQRLRRRGLAATIVPAPPFLPARARRGVALALRHWSPTCLERSLVLQRWLASQGQHLDVVIGVATASGEFRAHAWLDGESDGGAFQEISRVRGGPT
jgi:hypothetical protein